jgi:antitoxin MazE
MASTKMRDRGQVTIPRAIREAAHLQEGDPVEVEMVDEGILLRPQRTIDASQAWFWTEEWQAGERRATEDIREGRTEVFKSGEEFVDALRRRRH